jgi:hypothetical protein
MVTDRFRFEKNNYVIAFQDNDAMVFYKEELDSFKWFSDPIMLVNITNDVHNTIKLLRLLAEKAKQLLHGNKIKYFYFTVEDDRRKQLYIKLLKKFSRYEYQVAGDTINVFKIANKLKTIKDE